MLESHTRFPARRLTPRNTAIHAALVICTGLAIANVTMVPGAWAQENISAQEVKSYRIDAGSSAP